MIIDEDIIKDGIPVRLLAKLIEKHHRETSERYSRLGKYYYGEHDILNRRQKSTGAANNKIVANHAKYIVDIATSYLLGNPITYAASEGVDIEPLKNAYLEQDIASVDYILGKYTSIYGRAYELVYMSDDIKPRSVKINPEQAFICYNDDCTHFPLFGVYYYKTHDIDGNVSGVVCNVYTDTEEITYQSKSDNWFNMTETYRGKHYFGAVPMIEYINNEERQGDFEQLISQIDAYNKLMSDRVNDKEQFVDAFLFLKNIEIDSEQAKRLKEEKILMSINGAEDADAKYLYKNLKEADTKVLRDDLKEDIHRLSKVPDLSDNSFGNNLSGVAIKYKLMGFTQHIKTKESSFAAGLKKRFELYNKILCIKDSMQIVPIHRVDIVFTHNLPANNTEIAQMITYLKGMATDETLLGQLDFVSDPSEEAELARKEQAGKAAENARIINGAYAEPTYNGDEK